MFIRLLYRENVFRMGSFQCAISHRRNCRSHRKISVEEWLERHSFINSVNFQRWRSCFKYTESFEAAITIAKAFKIVHKVVGLFFPL